MFVFIYLFVFCTVAQRHVLTHGAVSVWIHFWWNVCGWVRVLQEPLQIRLFKHWWWICVWMSSGILHSGTRVRTSIIITQYIHSSMSLVFTLALVNLHDNSLAFTSSCDFTFYLSFIVFLFLFLIRFIFVFSRFVLCFCLFIIFEQVFVGLFWQALAGFGRGRFVSAVRIRPKVEKRSSESCRTHEEKKSIHIQTHTGGESSRQPDADDITAQYHMTEAHRRRTETDARRQTSHT